MRVPVCRHKTGVALGSHAVSLGRPQGGGRGGDPWQDVRGQYWFR
jgi:hypothetical protein